jgi:hypothetical protein
MQPRDSSWAKCPLWKEREGEREREKERERNDMERVGWVENP